MVFPIRNLVIRLFKDQLEGVAAFPEAEGIIWDLKNKGNAHYLMTTSEKWINENDFSNLEFEGNVILFIGKSEQE